VDDRAARVPPDHVTPEALAAHAREGVDRAAGRIDPSNPASELGDEKVAARVVGDRGRLVESRRDRRATVAAEPGSRRAGDRPDARRRDVLDAALLRHDGDAAARVERDLDRELEPS
jgi:hypothetical protein